MLESEILSALIATIYDAAIDPELWPQVLEGIRDFICGCAANFYWQDVSKENAGIFHCVGIDPSYLDSYFETYTRLNPLYPAAAFFTPGEVFGSDAVLPRQDLLQTRFYDEWMRPQGMVDSLCANLEKSVDSVAALAVIRGERDGPVDDEAKRRMRLVVPHMIRASSISHVVAEHMRGKAVLTDALDRLAAGVLLVDAAGRTIFANAAAGHLLNAGQLLRNGPAGLTATNLAANRALRSALRSLSQHGAVFDTAGASILLSPEQNECWLAHVLPLTSGARQASAARHSAVAAVFVRKASLDTPSPLEMITRLYNLTGTEVRVLQAIVATGGVPDVAAALGISESTVRSHLKRLFDKTSTHRQADLVKLVATHANPFF
ncbi:MAG TPA: helix-turn-helix transcriptional regulator [Bradyrhizobium sp.]|nr:helix-turn-helix transcriptional regulator [Bradyrhizobium sp.]